MIPVIRQVQNKVICRFYNLRQSLNQGMQTYVNSVEKNARKYVEYYEKNKEEVESSPTYERETYASRNVNHRNDCAPRNANHRICASRSTNESRALDGGRYWLGR